MKLIKGNPEKCIETTGKGTRCTRDAVEHGYCRQHLKIAKEKGQVLNVSGNKPLEEIPEPPVELEKRGMHSWKIYCQQMIDEARLYQSYLYPLADLCDLEDQLAEVRREMREKGVVNIYDNAVQRNGYASHYDKILQHIRNLRSDYGLTEAHRKDVTPKQKSVNEQEKTVRTKTVTGYQGN